MKTFKDFLTESGRVNERENGWSLTYNPTSGNLNLTNMSKLSNAIDVFKNKGIGDNRFYITHKNSSVKTDGMDESRLYNYIQSHFKGKSSLPIEFWNKFVTLLKAVN